MLQHLFGRGGKVPYEVTSQDVFAEHPGATDAGVDKDLEWLMERLDRMAALGDEANE